MIKLDNGILSAEISTTGGQLQNLFFNGENRLWNADPAYWANTAPIVFPICGGLKDDKYTYKGKEYTMQKHGFARSLEYEIEFASDTKATFLLKSSPETLKQYPWDFELRITYTLRGSCLDIDYDVKNTSSDTMYMSVGSHEGYACPEGIEDYDIIFDKKETLFSCDLDGNLISDKRTPIIKDTDTLPLYYNYFSVDALVFKDLRSRSLELRNRKTGKSLTIDFDGFDYLLLWTKPGAGYICIEPWTGIAPMASAKSDDISEKEGITALKPSADFKVRHTMNF